MKVMNHLISVMMPLVPKPLAWIVSRRYVAGSKQENAIETVKTLNSQGITATLDVLGESAKNHVECEQAVQEYSTLLQRITKDNLNCYISIKLSQMGLDIDKELCFKNVNTVVTEAEKRNIFVRIDMEDSSLTTNTLNVFQQLQKEHSNVGIVLQAYLRRSMNDLKSLLKTNTNFRLCKGIYNEARKIAYKDPVTINDNFVWLVETALRNNSFVGIATHDERVIWHSIRLIEDLHLDNDQYEFQMLLGVDEDLRDILVNSGYPMRVYVPYGKQWYAYCMRRLKENPKIAFHVTKAFLGIKQK